MNKQKNKFKIILIIVASIFINLAVFLGFIFILEKYSEYEITTDKAKYQEVIGIKANNPVASGHI